jgi:nucleobase:cation symporter-1, NCS1 family
MLRSIWPSFANLPNGFPNSGTTTAYYLSFFLFWLFSLPAIWFPVYEIWYLFTVKSYTVPVAGVVFMVWAIVKAGGVGPIVHQGSTVHGSAKAWACIGAIMDCVSNFATLIVNDPDFARFAKKPRDALWSQLFTIPIGFALTSFIGVIVSSSSNIIYGQPIWVRSLYEQNADLRTLSICWTTSLMTIPVPQLAPECSLSRLPLPSPNLVLTSPPTLSLQETIYLLWCHDISTFAEAVISLRWWGLSCVPGKFWAAHRTLHLTCRGTSSTISLAEKSYSVFLSSIAGVIFTDYYAIRKGYFSVPNLYTADHDGPYWYAGGFNPKAYVSHFPSETNAQIAYVFGIIINVVGFAGAVGQTVPIGATYIYRLNFFAGFIVASLTYYILCRIWPAKAVPERWTEDGNQDVIEARLAQADDYEQGDWKMRDGHERLQSDYDAKLHPTDSPPAESNF